MAAVRPSCTERTTSSNSDCGRVFIGVRTASALHPKGAFPRLIMSPIASNLQEVRGRIQAAQSARAQRAFPSGAQPVALVAVSKTQPPEAIRAAFAAGQRAFGENYVQEALAKQAALADLPLEWHFIGPIQSNKARSIASHFDWVHGVERMKVAELLARARAPAVPLNVCVQVNVSGEASKAGVAPADAGALALAVAALPGLRLRGLMTIIENTADPLAQRAQFRMLRELAERIRGQGVALDTLSMGMSQDYETAIGEGANLVRIGSAIFGARARAPA